MYPAKYNIRFFQGDTWTISPIWRINGVLVDVTGYTADMQVRTDVDSATVVVELSTANGRIVTGGTNGTFTLTLTAAQTAALTAGSYVYDLEVTSTTGVVSKILRGSFTVDPEVTR